MRPVRSTPAHQTGQICRAGLLQFAQVRQRKHRALAAERRDAPRRFALLEIARETAVPAGHALAVDRANFSPPRSPEPSRGEPLHHVHREEVTSGRRARRHHHHRHRPADFRRALAGDRAPQRRKPTSSLLLRFHQPHRRSRVHRHGAASTWPRATTRARPTTSIVRFTREEYDRFYDALLAAESVEERDWEKLNYFEAACPSKKSRGADATPCASAP